MTEYAGGAPAIRTLAETHYGRCVTDPVLSEVFGNEPHPEHVVRLADWLGEVLGGPDIYTRSHGGHTEDPLPVWGWGAMHARGHRRPDDRVQPRTR